MVLAILVFAGASFFFALAETALFSLSNWQRTQLAEKTTGTGKIVFYRTPFGSGAKSGLAPGR